MNFEDSLKGNVPKVSPEDISRKDVSHEGVVSTPEDVKTPKTEITHLERAEGEIDQAENLVRLEDQASQFRGTVEKLGIPWSVDTAGQFENDYAVPATVQAETLQDTIVQNSLVRNEAAREIKTEKPFNEVSRIIGDKGALCIHIMTGLSNEHNKTTGTGALSPKDFESIPQKKIDQTAISQLKTLAGLSPSASASFFADTHMFDESWYRGVSQPIGTILRKGVCVGISAADADTVSRSVKKRAGAEAATEERLDRVLSKDDAHFTKSGYNEAAISEPRIGALFIPTKGGVSREILETLHGESLTYGYPVFLEHNGSFFELSQDDRAALLQDTDERISVKSQLQNGKVVSRDEIRQRMAALDSEELQKKEAARFDKYLENYDLKPHFSWSENLATIIDTEMAFHLAQEEQKLEGYKKGLIAESEKEGDLTRRLHAYFSANPNTKKVYEERKKIYVNGEFLKDTHDEYLEEDKAALPPGAQIEVRTTKIWEYEQEVVEPPVLIEAVQGVGEASNIQKKRYVRMRVMERPDGQVFYDTSEKTQLVVSKMNAKTGEAISNIEALEYFSNEIMEKTVDGLKKTEGGFRERDLRDVYRPQVIMDQAAKSFIDVPDDMRKKIAENTFNAEQLKRIALYAKTLVEMYQKSGDEVLKIEWQGIADSISSDVNERYAFIRSKLNRDGTLKLDKDDAEEL